MRTDNPREAHDPSRGAIIRLFGVIIVILGTLDSMLMWRGGFALSGVYVLMIATGVVLYAIGAIRGGQARKRQLTPVKAGDRSIADNSGSIGG